eukprot:gene13582-30541_t
MTAAGIVSNGKGDNATLKKKKKKKKKKKNPQHMVAEVDSRNGVEKGTNKKQAAAAQSSEIDDIFGAPKSSKAKAKPAVEIKPKKGKRQQNMMDNDDDDFSDSRGLKRKARKIVDGIKVYGEDELKLGTGGGTPLCPFDCACCF